MKETNNFIQKLKSTAGFTLVEALIVLAILGVLAAVAIPAYSIQLENSRIKVDEATLATASSMAVSDFLLNYSDMRTSNVQIYEAFQQKVGSNTQIKIVPAPRPPGFDPNELVGWGPCLPNSQKYAGKTIFVAIAEGSLMTAVWR